MNDETAPGPVKLDEFLKLDLRVGTVVDAYLNAKAIKPAYVLKIDFGELGVRQSSAQITENHTAESLPGDQVIAVFNFPPKRVAGIVSEVLVLAAVCPVNGTVLLKPSSKVKNGTRIL